MKCPVCGEENEYDPKLSNLGNLCWSCDTPINIFGWLENLKSLEAVLKKETGDIRIVSGSRWLHWSTPNWIIREQKPYQKKSEVLYCGSDLSTAVEYLNE